MADGRIFFGSLEETEKAHRDGSLPHPPMGSAALQAAIRAGNININSTESGSTRVMDFSKETKEAQDRHAQLLQRVEAERRARRINVPTLIEEVRDKLRELGHPVCLFGETPADRRERLRDILARMEIEREENQKVQSALSQTDSATGFGVSQMGIRGQEGVQMVTKPTGADEKRKEVYTVASEELIAARRIIAEFSFAKSHQRLESRRNLLSSDDLKSEVNRKAASIFANAAKTKIVASQMGDERPLSCCRFSPAQEPNPVLVASGSWNKQCTIWNADSWEKVRVLYGHKERITGVAWHPRAYVDSVTPLLVTGSCDHTATIWNCDSGEAVHTLVGHKDRLGMVDFHPTGNYVATASYDLSWRLWDVESGKELLLQDGHFKEVYAIAFHPDGSLVITGDLAGVGSVWDLRSGKSIMTLQGHTKKIITADCSPNGFHVVTGSEDHTAKVWDLRRKRNSYTILAHSSMISEVRFGRSSGEIMLTSSFDKTAKIWNTRDWSLIHTLVGHEGKIMSADISPNEKTFVTAGFDRTLKFWAVES